MLDAIPVSVCRLLVETLGHSLWQACLIAVACWLALRVLPARRTNLRYATACCGLLAIVGSSLVTLSLLEPVSPDLASSEDGAGISNVQTAKDGMGSSPQARLASFLPEASVGTGKSSDPKTVERAEVRGLARFHASRNQSSDVEGTGQLLHLLALVWAAGSLLMLVRVVRSVLQIRQLGAESESGQVTSDLLDRIHAVVADVSTRLGLRSTVSVLISSRVQVPGVVGTFWPILLMPPALVTGVPLEQLRIVIAHELAHVRRYDFLVNLAQMVIEALLFFNPAVWWVSRQIRIEREACCDAMAVSATGEAIPVARALVEVVARLRESLGESTANGFAIAAGVQQLTEDPQQENLLLDRVRRLIVPEQRPHVRLPWYSLFGFLAALVVFSAGLYEGTDAAVKAVQRAIAPMDRVEALARLKAEYSGLFVPGGTGRDSMESSDAVASPHGESDPESDGISRGEVKVNVTVKTDDGSPVPARTLINLHHTTGRRTSSKSRVSPDEDVAEFTTTWQVPSCLFAISARAKGFAVVMTKPRNVFTGDGTQDIDLVLSRGFDATIQLRDSELRPIAQARLKLSARFEVGDSWNSSNARELTSDEFGVVHVERLSEMPYNVEVRRSGFQHDERIIRFSADATVDWNLQSAQRSPLQIVDGSSGEPISGARVVTFARFFNEPGSKGSFNHGEPRETTIRTEWRTYGKSDEEGRILLDELQHRSHYIFAVQAEGFGTTFLTNVKPGQTERRVRLKPPLNLTGRLSGDLSRLNLGRGTPGTYELQYVNDIQFPGWPYSGLFTTTVTSDGHFELRDLVLGKVVLLLPDGRKTLAVDGSLDELRFAIEETDAAFRKPSANRSDADDSGRETREVILRLKGATSDLPARGQLYVTGQLGNDGHNGPLPIVDNEVRLQIPVGIDVRFWPRDVVGYIVKADRKQSVRILPGETPQIIDIPTEPAGAVIGEIVRPDGSPAKGGSARVFVSKLFGGLFGDSDVNPSSAPIRSTFYRTLPLGQSYFILGSEQVGNELSWAKSEAFSIDDSNPIQKLKMRLKPGKNLSVNILNSLGKPVVDTEVEISILAQCSGTKGRRGWRLSTKTNGSGLAAFASVLPDNDVSPVDVTATLIVPGPPGHVGFYGPVSELDEISPSRFEVRLSKAVSTKGVLLDAKSGRPVPYAKIEIWAFDNRSTPEFGATITTTTDASGRFLFDNLEPLKYRVKIDDAFPKGTVVTRRGGGYSYSHPDGIDYMFLRGGADPVRLEVELLPGGTLRPAAE